MVVKWGFEMEMDRQCKDILTIVLMGVVEFSLIIGLIVWMIK